MTAEIVSFSASEILLFSLATLLVSGFFATILPGFERKIHARIQQRIGPPLLTPGFWSILKFAYKKRIKPNSPSPMFYHSFVLVSLSSVTFILLFSTPYWWGVLGFGSLFAIVGLLKVEEIMYLFMGNFSNSVMSSKLPYPDQVTGAKFENAKRGSIESQGAQRALKMVTIGSFPMYLAMFIPFVMVASIAVGDVVSMQNPVYSQLVASAKSVSAFDQFNDSLEMLRNINPLILTLPGFLGAIIYFLGYNIITNNRPFDIIKPKVDIIEGPLMEYAAIWRAFVYILNAMLSFTMASLFVTFFIGIPLDIRLFIPFVFHLILCFMLPAAAAILRAFSPVLTFNQIYPVSIAATVAGIVVIGLTYII
ncbi:MAG: NADH-quinone oxidoreductase subunit H [Candidatus Altiarchaeota archaeon]